MLFVLFSYLPCELALIVLLVGLLYRNKSKTLRYFNFSMVFLVFTLGFYSFLVNATGDEKIAETADLFYRVAVSSTLSMFLVFFRVLVGKPLTIALSFLMVLPPIVIAIISLVLGITLGADVVGLYLDAINRHGYNASLQLYTGADFRIVFVCTFLYALIIMFQTLLLTLMLSTALNHNKFRISQIINAFRGIPMSSANVIAILLILLSVLLLILSLSSRSLAFQYRPLFIIIFLLVSVFIILIGNIAIVYPHSKVTFSGAGPGSGPKNFDAELYRNMHQPQSPSDTHSANYLNFYSYFIDGKAYLDPDMTVEKVCSEMQTNRTYISQLLNKEFGMSFRDLLCRCRVDYSKRLMKEQPNLSFDDVAKQSGFKSSSQFSKKFKEMETLAPSRWKSIYIK